MQRLCVADFKHPCLKLWAFNFGHPCPSLVKGEVLSPEKIRATTGGIAFLPHPFRFSDTFVNNPSIVGSASHCNRSSPLHKGAKGDSALPTIPKPHYPSKIAKTLASLVKGEVLSPKKNRATTGGIAAQLSLASHQPSQNRTIPCFAPHSWLPCQRELDCDKAISYYKLQHSAISSTLIFAQPYLSQD